MHGVYDGDHTTVTIKEAAERLGISEQAVRQRIRRKTLPAQRLDGRLYVVLSAEYDVPSHEPNSGHDDVASAVRDAYNDLVSQLRSENELLRQQLTVKDDQIRANQVIISQLSDQLRSLPASIERQPVQQEETQAEAVPQTPRPWWKFWE